MFIKALVATLVAAGSFAMDNSTLGACSYSATCSVSGIEGVCVSVSAGCCSGAVTANLCPGSTDIKCCTSNPCSTPQGSGRCVQASACSGTPIAGYCVGPTDLQCCVGSAPPPSGGGAAIVKAAQSMIGLWPYSWGGGDTAGASHGTKETEAPYCDDTSVKGFDCSGLSLYSVYHGAGASLSHNAQAQFNTAKSMGRLVAQGSRQPGDLLFYGTSASSTAIYHVTIFAGGSVMVEAPGHYSNCTGMLVTQDSVRSSDLVADVARFW
jgi:hypothetical protein